MRFDIDALVARYLTERLDANANDCVGVEAEYPIISRDGRPVNMGVVRGLMDFVYKMQFEPQKYDADGNVYEQRDPWGNVLKFDTSYATVEYASAPGDSLINIRDRFLDVYPMMQVYFTPTRHMLVSHGINQTRGAQKAPLVPDETTMLIDSVIRSTGCRTNFYKQICSEQVHFNSNSRELPKLLCMLTYVNPASVLMFANSPYRVNGEWCLCARNELYRHSCFNKMGLTGALPLGADTLEEYVQAHKKMCLFYRRRNGRLERIPPTPVERYFSDPSFDAQEEDIWCLDPVKNAVVTLNGTVEYRMNCTQKLKAMFAPSAFMLGLRCELDKTLSLCREFYARHKMTNIEWIISYAARRGTLPNVSRDDTLGWLNELMTIAYKGLKKRQRGEQMLLDQLRYRRDIMDNQAQVYMREYDNFRNMFVQDYASVPVEAEWYWGDGKKMYLPYEPPANSVY